MQRVVVESGVQLPLVNTSSSLTSPDEKTVSRTTAITARTSTSAQGIRSGGERHAGVSLLILSDAPTLEIEGDFPASVLGSPAGTVKGKTLMGLSGEEGYPSLMSITSEAKLRQQS